MKVLVLVVMLCASASANCGCLKCSKHLETMDITGPDGQPIKVIFQPPNGDCCTCSVDVQMPQSSGYSCQQPTATSKVGGFLNNLRFRLDRVLTSARKYPGGIPAAQHCTCPCNCHCANPSPLPTPGSAQNEANGRQKRQLPYNWLANRLSRRIGRSDSPSPPALENSLRSSFWKPATLSAMSQQANEASLLKKLKRLNNNPFCGDVEGQATDFVRKLLKPPVSGKRSKRTIVVGSDELDLPAHYKVDLEHSEEDDEEPAPVVRDFGRRFSGRRMFPQPDLVMGRSVIQKVVRQELNAHQKKLEKQQRMNKQGMGVPQNPIYLLLTAPMQFLDHFRKGGTPLTALPKMVITAKRCLKDLGQNFHKHCLNLASNVIGDFDDPEIGRRYRRAAVPLASTRKKRYVIKVVDEDDIQHEVEDYLAQKMNRQFSHIRPLQDYVGDLFDSAALRPKVKLSKVHPRLIIDNRGLPFMEFDGMKRPLRLRPRNFEGGSAEEATSRIVALLSRARQHPEVVGNGRGDHAPHLPPKQLLKERISSLLEEIDQLVQLHPEHYDQLFELLIRLQQVKTSIELDWKRLIMDNRLDDMGAKLELLSKLKELQDLKNESVKNIAGALKLTDNEFVRKQLIHSLVRLQKLQCLVNSVVEDCEQHLKTRTPFNVKKEVKYVDTLAELKFVYSKSRSDLVEKLNLDRDQEVQGHLETLNGLKKLLVKADQEPDKFEQAAKLLWEMSNLEKLLVQSVKEMNRKLARSYRIKKELKILFDLQKRFEECEAELSALVGDAKEPQKKPPKKDMKEVMEEVRRRHEGALQKAKERAAKLKGGG